MAWSGQVGEREVMHEEMDRVVEEDFCDAEWVSGKLDRNDG
jgi:hypothetical protein